MKRIRVGFLLKEDIKEKIREVAFKKRISEAELIRRAIGEFIKKLDKK